MSEKTKTRLILLICLIVLSVPIIIYTWLDYQALKESTINEVTVEQADTTTVTENVKPKKSFYNFIKIGDTPSNFDTIPGGDMLFRSNQPSITQLVSLLQNYPIEHVIRMNGEEGTGVSPETERQIVESFGKKYYWIDAHQGYEPGKGYTKSIDTVQKILCLNNVLIHCTAGKDRTGYQVGRYIQDNLGWSKQELWDYTIKYNDWERFILKEEKKGYIRYLEAFYPYKELLRDQAELRRKEVFKEASQKPVQEDCNTSKSKTKRKW